ncbi:cytochrome P450 [Nakamurella endophytica]|uniref:cytochrome P450 n=1 Tax=Nakamurella endophytica TaxID=1748367 RepID=UPI001667C602|nr:cytochrome P450 [Nakamurella endophytica]
MNRTPQAHVPLDLLTADPHPVWARLRELGEVVWVPEIDGWVTVTRAAAAAVMRDARSFTVDDPRFSTSRIVGASMLSTDGAAHTAHRRPWADGFRPVAVRDRFTEALRQEIDRLLDDLAEAAEPDLRTGLAAPLATAAMAQALGLSGLEVGQVLDWYRAMVAGVDEVTRGGEPPAAALRAMAGIRHHVAHALSEPASGSVLSDAAAAGGDPAVLAADVAVLLFGGVDTAESMTAIAAHHLLSHPDALRAVAADPALLPGAVQESLRLEPAATRVDRYATADVELAGAAVRAGDLVVVSLSAANRDPAVFDDPDTFDIHRENADQHLSFAIGPHYCLGVHLTTLQTTLALTLLLERFPGIRAAGPLPPVQGFVFRKPLAVPVLLG